MGGSEASLAGSEWVGKHKSQLLPTTIYTHRHNKNKQTSKSEMSEYYYNQDTNQKPAYWDMRENAASHPVRVRGDVHWLKSSTNEI